MPVYALSVDKAGLKLKPAAEPLGNVNTNSGKAVASLSGKGLTMRRFSDVLSSMVERPVIDETGLDGAFDVDLKYSLDLEDPSTTPTAAAKDAQAYPSLFTAMKEQPGLHLTGKKGQATVWVVLRAEKPGEN